MGDRHQIERFQRSFRPLSDAEFLHALKEFPVLAPEDAPQWEEAEYWNDGLYQFLALAEESARRRLEAAIPLLLDRATDFDQDGDLEGLRHCFEEIMTPRWAELADICMDKARSDHAGTRKWSFYQLTVLDDMRAKTLFERALLDPHPDIQDIAQIGLERLAYKAKSARPAREKPGKKTKAKKARPPKASK